MSETLDLPTPTDDVVADDHLLSAWAATVAGEQLAEMRGEGLYGKALKDAGDALGHRILMRLLTTYRPDDAILSEEGKDDKARLQSRRVWIVDPLDGTREYSEPPREDWAIHVALWEDGDLVAGAVAQPGMSTTFSTAAPPSLPARTKRKAQNRRKPDPTSDVHRGAGRVPRCGPGSDGFGGGKGHLSGT